MMYPKASKSRNPNLLAMARDMPCLLRSAVCNNDSETVIAAHSNQSKHGKGIGHKAGDQYSIWCCARCHTWLDQSYTATKREKFEAFDEAHLRQVEQWRVIAADPRESESDRKAAKWALAQL